MKSGSGKRTLSFCLALVLLFSCASCAERSQEGGESHPVYAYYKDIPGVTAEEIEAITQIERTHLRLFYGMNETTEAFYREDGTIGGYAALLCDWLTNLFGIRFVPELYPWDQLIDELENGKVDFTGELTATPQRLERYYMTESIAERSIKIFTKKDSESLGTIARRRNPRFGFLSGATSEELILASYSGTFDSLYVDSYEEATEALLSGRMDAFFEEGVAEAAFVDSEFIVGEDYFPLIYSPVSLATADEELAPIISVVQKYLDQGAIYHLINLYNQGEQEYLRLKLRSRLTDEETEYLDRMLSGKTPVKMAMEYDNYPASFYNDQEGEFQGIALDVIGRVSQLTGLEFVPANPPGTEWHDLLEMLAQGEVSLITEMIPSSDRKKRYIWTDTPYSEDQYALLSRTDMEYIGINQVLYLKVGLIYEAAYTDVFFEWFPDHSNHIIYNNTIDAFDALERGEIDLLMASRNLLLSVTNYLEMPGYKANLVFDRSYDSRFAFNREEELLCSIVSKAQMLVDTDSIADLWVRKVFDYRSRLARVQVPWLIASLVLLMAVMVLMLILFLKNRQMSKRLEAVVRERTAELEVQTQAAQVASLAKGDFLARMSHEIRTPLNAIIGMAKIAEQSVAGVEKAEDSIGEILKASAHLMGILNDVLDMSKIEAGKFSLSLEPMDLKGSMEEVQNIITQRCREKSILFTTNLPELPGHRIVGDKLRLKQVLINLLGNAVKFTDEGGRVSFFLDASGETDREVTVRFMVADSGIGMSREQVSGLFVAFEQADSSISARFGGTGLGLAISQNLIGLMGGTITVVSAMGKGSTFEFTLTFPKTDAEPERPAEEDLSLDLTGKRILIAEDIEINRVILMELLEDTGLLIDEAADGLEAVQIFQQSPDHYYDLIFMDIMMPNLNGYEATQQIRALPRADAATVEIVAMTANAYKEDIERAGQAGMNGHLAKPIDIDAVKKLLAEKLCKAPRA